jgi:hypothetical protein
MGLVAMLAPCLPVYFASRASPVGKAAYARADSEMVLPLQGVPSVS